MTSNSINEVAGADSPAPVQEARLWSNNGWTARVIKNEDDEGWAVEMLKHGETEPALVGPWTMGRDKKNPKPLDAAAFNTLVKTASEFLQRQVQQLRAAQHQNITINMPTGRVSISLDRVADEDDYHALLTAHDAYDEQPAQVRVDSGFRLSKASAIAWIDDGFRKPR